MRRERLQADIKRYETAGLEVDTGNDTIVEEDEKAGMADGCFLRFVCTGADLF